MVAHKLARHSLDTSTPGFGDSGPPDFILQEVF